ADMCGFGDQWNKAAAEAAYEAGEATTPVEEGRALLIFVKNPEKGKVKTRLAKTIGEDAALAAYMDMLAHTRAVALDVEADRSLYYTSFVDHEDAWPAAHFHKRLQAQGDLGARMYSAFADIFGAGHRKVLIIGSDCLDLRLAHLEAAFSALDDHDFVVGPAEDGGYYLLGMRELTPRVFENKQWSTESVLPDTLHDIQTLGRTVHTLDTLSDIDYEEDLREARARNQSAHKT
ncbi:MAG: TIGR04282 family arsenosugar biosynthesis glycosyltransferase, partial [Bacteroidota bacterium]